MSNVEPAHQQWAQLDLNWRFGDKNNVRWSKKLSLIERRYFFLEIDKTCPKWFVQSIFILSPIMAKVEPAHQINTNSTEINDLVTKTMFGDRKC